MQLSQALRFTGAGAVFTQPPRLAFVGAGGKTTAMFTLASQLKQGYESVFVTTTTHLGTAQSGLADRHVIVERSADLPTTPPQGVVLFTGPEGGDGRLAGLDTKTLESLLELADRHRIPLLIEADGSRLRPLKAPAGHEPAMPGFVDTAVVVAGLSGLGKPLTENWVHRPEFFGRLAGLDEGQQITPPALVQVLTHPQGGLKGIPAAARRVLLLNQADSDALREEGEQIAQMCLGDYAAAVVSALTLPSPGGRGEKGGSLRAERSNLIVSSIHEPTAIILLAAGASTRFGRPKQLIDWQGQPLVRHVAALALSAEVQRIRVVVGAYQAEVRQALEGLPVEIVENPDWREGQAASVRAGIQGLPMETGGALFMLVDQPQVPTSLLKSLVELHAERLTPLTAPLCQGRRANPVLFDRTTFPDLLTLRGDTGGRQLFASPRQYEVSWLPWEDESLLWDMDTEEDYRRFIRKDNK